MLFIAYTQAQTGGSPSYNITTTKGLKLIDPSIVTSVNFLPAFGTDGITFSKIDPVNLPLSNAAEKGLTELSDLSNFKETITITQDGLYNAFPSVEKASNGDLLTVYRKGVTHLTFDGSIRIKRSTDNGDTWSSESTIVTGVGHDYRDPSIARLANGNIIMSYFDRITDSNILIYTSISTDNGITFGTPVQLTGYADYGAVSSRVIQLANGDLLLATYGKSGASGLLNVFKSTNNGTSWSILSTISTDAFVPNFKYSEPSLLLLPNGNVVATVRNNSDIMVASSVSTDSGVTWSSLVNKFSGHSRAGMVYFDGKIITTYRNNVGKGAVRMSKDEGMSWGDEVEVYGTELGEQDEYSSLVNVKKNIYAYVYSRQNSTGSSSSVKIRYFNVPISIGTIPYIQVEGFNSTGTASIKGSLFTNNILGIGAGSDVSISTNTSSTSTSIFLKTGGLARISILGNGNVGFGITPTQKVDVSGNIKASGIVYSPTVSTQFVNSNSSSGVLKLVGGATNYGGSIDVIAPSFGSNGGGINFRTGLVVGESPVVASFNSSGKLNVVNTITASQATVDTELATLGQVKAALGGKLSGSNYPDYVAQNAPASIASATYQSFPLILRSNYGKVLLFYRDGADHATSKGIVKMRISEDGGGNFGGETTIATDAVYDCRNVSGGITPTGRIVLFYMRYNFTSSTSFDQGFIYSDDDGSTWSNYQTIPSGTHSFFSPYGEMISIGNNKLMACWYGETPATPTYSTYVITSSDNGLTWSSAVAVATSTTLRYGESSYAYLDGGVIVGHVRNSTGSPLYQVISTDNGATWTNQGVTTVDTSSQVSPMLATFIDPNNQKYIVSFYANRGDNKLKVAIAEYATAVAGVNGWTRTDIDSHTSTDFGYPSFIKSKENNKFLIAYYKAASTTLASIYFKNYTPAYGNIAVNGAISSTGNISSSGNVSAVADVSGKDIKASNTLQVKGIVTAFPTVGNGLEVYNSTSTQTIIQSYDRAGSVYNQLNYRGSLQTWNIGATERMRLHASGGVSIGNTTDLGIGTLNVTGNITAPAGTTANHVVIKSQLDLKADLASPALTGTPTAPTATVGTNTTQLATTAFVLANTNANGLLEFNTTDRTVWNNGKSNVLSNTTFGESSLSNNTTGFSNSAFGLLSLYSNTTGNFNSSFGNESMRLNVSGGLNSAFGYYSLRNNVSGGGNTAIGTYALTGSLGNNNTGVGQDVFTSLNAGNDNLGLGWQAGRYIIGGSIETTSLSNSIYIGSDSKASANGVSNEIVIGYSASGSGSNTATLGNSSITKTILGGVLQKRTLDTAPASATATGTQGEIRVTSTHIYVCIATNTWVRSALTTWVN